MITKIKHCIIAPLAICSALVLTGCTLPEEPESHSEQGQTMNESPSTPSKKDKSEPQAQWVGHMDEISVGMSQSEVKAILGKPDDTSSNETSIPDFSSDGNMTEKTMVMDMWTYGNMFDSADGDDTWVLSFQDGELDSKSRM